MKSKTSSRIFFFHLLLLLALLSCFPKARPQEVDDEEEFSYEEGNPNGPENWGEIHKDWAACNGRGGMQSPIDLVRQRIRVSRSLGRLKRSYKPAKATLKNRGHDIMLGWEGDAGSIRINGTEYLLKQCHWHSPSEHTVDGRRFALELHMVHQSEDQKIAVVGIMYKIGRPDYFLKKLEKYIKKISINRVKEEGIGLVNPRQIKIRRRKYFRYMGSLTTPPCTEGVTWTINRKIQTASRKQVRMLRDAVYDETENNARPTQPINDREIFLFKPKAHRGNLLS